MHRIFAEFIAQLDRQHKERCIQIAISNLNSRNIDIVTLYNEVLTPALTSRYCQPYQKEICIWEEHARTSIIRTIIESCYLFITRERDERYRSSFKGKVAVVCPPGELHEIGARMVSDFFTLCGFNVVFIGANTPAEDIISAIKYIRPGYVAISITSYYNLMAARNTVKQIQNLKDSLTFKIILGGQACQGNLKACQQMDPDLILNSFNDIQCLSEGKINATP